MCMLDDSDGCVTMLSEATPVARKAHKCRECGRQIAAGERYHVERYLWEGKLHNHKTCAHCDVARQWLQAECGGWLYGDVKQNLRELAVRAAHAVNTAGHVPLMRLAVGMKWKWRAPSGRLLGVPRVPQTHLARAAGGQP